MRPTTCSSRVKGPHFTTSSTKAPFWSALPSRKPLVAANPVVSVMTEAAIPAPAAAAPTAAAPAAAPAAGRRLISSSCVVLLVEGDGFPGGGIHHPLSSQQISDLTTEGGQHVRSHGWLGALPQKRHMRHRRLNSKHRGFHTARQAVGRHQSKHLIHAQRSEPFKPDIHQRPARHIITNTTISRKRQQPIAAHAFPYHWISHVPLHRPIRRERSQHRLDRQCWS